MNLETGIWNLKTGIFGCAVCVILSGSAHAQQRPLVTEDPETIGAGRILLEGGFSFETDQANSATCRQRRCRTPRLIWRKRRHQPDRGNTNRRRTAAAPRRHERAPSPVGPQHAFRGTGDRTSERGRSHRRHEDSARVGRRVTPGVRPAIRHQAADRVARERRSVSARPISSRRS